MTKYFSYDALEGELYFHNSEQEAKEFALKMAEASYEETQEWDGSITEDVQDDIKSICYGAIFGGIDLPTRPSSTEEDGEDVAAEFKYIVRPPVIVDHEQRPQGWIKCSDRLPPVNEDGESCSVLLYGMDILSDFGSHQFIGYLMDGKFYCDDGHSPHQCYYVSHWQPLTPPTE